MSDSPQMSDKQASFARSYRHYIGQPANPLTVRTNDVDDNLIISLARLIVDKGVSFLFGKDLKTDIPDSDSLAAAPRQDWLDECWRRNKRGITLHKLAINGGIFGHAFIRILEPKQGPGMQYPRLIVLDPQIMDVMTDPDDCDTVWKFTITPPATAPADGEKPVQRRTVIANPSGQAGHAVPVEIPWLIQDQVFQGGAWLTTATAQWPYPFSPIVHCQNLPRSNDFWGESDLPNDVLKILEGINRVASMTNKILRLHSHPKIWTRGMGTRNLDLSVDSVISLPSDVAELKALEVKSDLAGNMNLLNKLLSLLSYMVRIPMVAMGEPDNLGAISGVALQIRYQPLLEKTETKRLTYGDLLVELNRCLLAMAPMGFGDTTVTHLGWPELLPSDPLQERQVAVLDDSLGIVSKETLAQTMGYNWEQEQQQRQDEHAADVAAGLVPSPDAEVPPPQTLQAPKPDIAKGRKSS